MFVVLTVVFVQMYLLACARPPVVGGLVVTVHQEH